MNAENAKKLSTENEKILKEEEKKKEELQRQKFEEEEKKKEHQACEYANRRYQDFILPEIEKAVAEGKSWVKCEASGDHAYLYREYLTKLLKKDGYEVEESYTTHDISGDDSFVVVGTYRRYTFKIVWV